MDIDQDFIRREAKAIEAEHQSALKHDRAMLDRLVDSGDGLAGSAEGDHVTDGLNRRRFFRLGGAAVAASAVIAACKGATPPLSVTPPTTTTTILMATPTDTAILRTAESIEVLLQNVYGTFISGGLVKTPATLDLIKLFQGQHAQHQSLFDRTARGAGATPFTQANPVLMQQLVQPRLAALKVEADVVSLAYDLEHMASATFQANIGELSHPALNTDFAAVLGTEARHVALWAIISGKSATGTPDNAFQVDTDAVTGGTGV
jgi:hypothetical protein